MAAGIDLKPGEIARAINTEILRAEFPPILTPESVGRMLGCPRSTVYEWVAKGRLDGCSRRRGKGVRFWRDRVLDRFFNGPEWRDEDNE